MKHHTAYVAAAIALILVGCEVDTTAPNSEEVDNSKPWPGAIGAAQSNYLLNGDFAAGSENWSSCGGESTHSVESADIRLTDQGCLYQEFPLSAGGSFTLSCLGRSVSNYSSITLSASDSAYETLESHVAQVSGATYDVSTVSFTAPAQAVRGVVTLYADTSADFDNCVVSPGLVTPEVPIDPPENSGNLISNSNFEAGMSFWSSCNSTGNVDTGDASARLSDGGCLYQEFPVVTGETYGFRCEGKSEINYSSLELIMSDSDYQPLVSSGEQVVTGSNYSQYNVAVAAATGSAQGVAILYAETDAEFDNCEVFAGALVEPPPVDTGNNREELANGDFTEGLTGWSVCGSNPSISQQGISDSRAVSLDAGGCLYQEFPVTTGADYTLRCAGLSSEGYTSMDLSMSDASYAQLEFDSQIVSSSVLQDYSVTLTAPPLAEYGVVTLYADSAALFDNCGINGQTAPVVTTDSDGDGVADSDDAFPDDITESRDGDNDGVGDNADAFPDDASETADSDGDGIGDNSDPFPTDANVPTPVVAFNFDEGSGSRVNDQAGNIDGTIRQFDNSGNAVALSEDFWSTRGFIGGALQMDGYESNSNSLVDVPVSSALSDITDQLSVMAWVKRSAPIANLSILSHDYPSFFFGYHGPQYKVEFFTRTGGQASCYVGSSQLEVWTHMATTYDGRVARLFVNGQEICSRNVSGDLDINTNTATRGGRFTVAGMYGYSNGIADELAGQMDNFRLFDKALGTEDISAYYDRDRAQHNEDNGVSGDSEFDGKTVSIAGFDSGKCVDIAGASLSDGANAVQYNCNASDRQTFDVEKVGDLYRFRARHSGQCLNINGASTAALARLIQWPCVGAANELWSIVDAGEGTYTLRPSHSGLCMNVSGAEESNNTIIIQWPCASDPFAQPNNQRWMLSIAQASADDGKWDGPYSMPTVAVAAVALPDGNVLAFSGADQFDYLPGDGRTYTSVFDTRTNQSSVVVVGNTQHDMFCPGITMLADGRVVVTGGKNEAVTSIYDPDAQSWSRSANMQISRGYHSSALTSDGGIFTVGGSWSGGIGEKGGELYRDGQWRRLTSIQSGPMNTRDAAGTYRADNHMWLFSAPNGKIFHAGPSVNMHWLGVDGSGEQQRAGTRGTVDAMNGTAVLYDAGKILVTGGAPSYDNSNALKSAYVIDISGGEGAVQTRQIADSAFSRAFHSSVVLPTGEVVIIGGQATTAPFSDSKSILAAEIWNPQSETFRTVGSMRVPRTYHSAAVLLKDARVWIGGGGYCGNSCDTNHPDAEIFTPPYLLAADGSDRARPVISVAPDFASNGQTISVTVSAEPSSFSLIRLGSATHAVNTDQRRIPIEGSALGGDDYALEIPTNRGSLIPGNYYLFAMDDNGTPSIGHTINIQ